MSWAKIIIGDSRKMIEIEDEAVDLVVTSPPYWHIKDYGVPGQIGYGQSLHEYLRSLYLVWKECYRVLTSGSRLCINVGDQFLRSVVYGRYKVAPLHSEIIVQCEKIGFDYMGSIIWQKKTTMNTTGGAVVMGTYPYPPNGMVEIDYEFILIFKKPGKKKAPSRVIKERSKLTKEEWKEYFAGHWSFGGERQIRHEAMFPEELPRRLIKMFTFVDDVVLDPFLGSGTTIKAALNLERNAIGYEINEEFLPIIKDKIGFYQDALDSRKPAVEFTRRNIEVTIESVENYIPSIKDANPINLNSDKMSRRQLLRVKRVIDGSTLELDDGMTIKLLGITVTNEDAAKNYLDKYVKGRLIRLLLDPTWKSEGEIPHCYVFLKNGFFVNKELIRLGFATTISENFSYKRRLEKVACEGRIDGEGMDIKHG